MKLTLLGVVPPARCARHPSCGVIGQMRVTKYPSHCYCHHYYRRLIGALCLWFAWCSSSYSGHTCWAFLHCVVNSVPLHPNAIAITITIVLMPASVYRLPPSNAPHEISSE